MTAQSEACCFLYLYLILDWGPDRDYRDRDHMHGLLLLELYQRVRVY